MLRTATMPSYTIEQVKTHCKPDDVWIILHNKGTSFAITLQTLVKSD